MSFIRFKYPPSLTASIIIPNFNGLAFLKECLTSLHNIDFPREEYEIIVVDNASTDGSVSFVKNNFKDVIVVQNQTNLGFGEAINRGMEISRGQYIICLNNDTVVDKYWLKELVQTANENEKVGIVGSKILFLKERNIINNAGSYISLRTGDGGDIGFKQRNEGQYDFKRKVASVCGASMLIKRSLIEEIGAFDSDFFLYYEDTDLCWRARLSGKDVIYTPNSIVYHVHAGTSKEWSPLFTFYAYRNKILMCIKNAPLSLVCRSVAAYFRQVLKEIKNPNRQIHFKIIKSLLKNSFLFAKKRLYVRNNCKKVHDQELMLLFKRNKKLVNDQVRRIGIYNAYLPTLGGGELQTAGLARALLEIFPNSQIDIICHLNLAFPNTTYFDYNLLSNWFTFSLFPSALQRRVQLKILKLPPIDSPFHKSMRELKIYLLSKKYDIFVNNTYRSSSIASGKLNIYYCMFPQRFHKIAFSPFFHLRAYRNYKFLTSYHIFLANSLFTKNYMELYWSISPFVLYPPIFPSKDSQTYGNYEKKKNLIITIGRFFAGEGHVKKHDVIIDACKRLFDSIPNWELILIGRRHKNKETETYIQTLMNKTKGYPIYFIFDASPQKIKELLSSAKIYIHATGYGENIKQHPDRFEHLGLAVLEAMSFGLIPVVFNGGGLPEIIQDRFNGFLFKTQKELVNILKSLVRSSDEGNQRIITNAKKTAAAFSYEKFKRRLELILQNYIL